MKCNYKYKGLAEKIKEILQKKFPKNKDLTDVKSALLDDDDFINKLTDAVKDDFTLDDMNRMFTKDEICSLIDDVRCRSFVRPLTLPYLFLQSAICR